MTSYLHLRLIAKNRQHEKGSTNLTPLCNSNWPISGFALDGVGVRYLRLPCWLHVIRRRSCTCASTARGLSSARHCWKTISRPFISAPWNIAVTFVTRCSSAPRRWEFTADRCNSSTNRDSCSTKAYLCLQKAFRFWLFSLGCHFIKLPHPVWKDSE